MAIGFGSSMDEDLGGCWCNKYELEELLKECIKAFNQIPNKKLKGKYKDTYTLTSKIEKVVK